MKRLSLAAVFGLASTALVALLIARPGMHWYDFLLFGPLVISTVVSRNSHQANEIVFWSVLFLELGVLFYLLCWLGARFRRVRPDLSEVCGGTNPGEEEA
jgi:apolipoprotein N-acyltransferase